MAKIYRVFKRLETGGAELLYEGEDEQAARHLFDHDDTHDNMRLRMTIDETSENHG